MSEEAARIAIALMSVEHLQGSLRFFGEWFGGRPYENVHRLMDVAADGDAVTLTFDHRETLRIEQPRGLKLSPESSRARGLVGSGPLMVIQSAARLRWQWLYYGSEKAPADGHFIEYVVMTGVVRRRSDRPDWLAPLPDDATYPAVELY